MNVPTPRRSRLSALSVRGASPAEIFSYATSRSFTSPPPLQRNLGTDGRARPALLPAVPAKTAWLGGAQPPLVCAVVMQISAPELVVVSGV